MHCSMRKVDRLALASPEGGGGGDLVGGFGQLGEGSGPDRRGAG